MAQSRIESVDRLYAQSLYELMESSGGLEVVVEQAEQLRGLLVSESGLQHLFDSRIITADQLSGSLERLFSGKIDAMFYRFIQVVNRKGRLRRLSVILDAFTELLDEKRGVLDVQAIVVAELPDDHAQRVAQRIGEVLGKNVRLNQQVDPSVIGGIKLRVGDRLIDGSVATQLKIIERRLITAGREKAKGVA